MTHPWFPKTDGSTLIDLLEFRARAQPDSVAYTFLIDGEAEGPSVTYGELAARARGLAVALTRAAEPGARALLLYPPGLAFIEAFFGCLYAGLVAVPTYPPLPKQSASRLRAIAADAGAALALTLASVRDTIDGSLRAGEASGVRLLATDEVDAGPGGPWQPPAVDGRSLAFLQYTSGSTGAPKGVMVTHNNILHNQELIREAMGHSERTVFVGWLPLYHDMGLIGNVLQPLYLGIRCFLMSPTAFLRRPARWLQAISRHGATTSGAPSFAFELCTRKVTPAEREGLDLSRWEVAFCGAEPIRPATVEQFTARFAPCGFRPEAFYPCYGMAEATLMVSGAPKGRPPRSLRLRPDELERGRAVAADADGAARTVVSCGRPAGGQRVMIIDVDTAEPCEAGAVGEVWVAGPSVAQGYWGRPEESRETFAARPAGTAAAGSPFLRTGDLGFWHDHELFITGRLKDLIIIHGRNYYPQDIELTAELSHPALRPGCGAAFSTDVDGEECLVIVHEVDRGHDRSRDDDIAGAITEAVAREHGLRARTVVLLELGAIPKTSSGKIRRRACRADYLEGRLSVRSPLPRLASP